MGLKENMGSELEGTQRVDITKIFEEASAGRGLEMWWRKFFYHLSEEGGA